MLQLLLKDVQHVYGTGLRIKSLRLMRSFSCMPVAQWRQLNVCADLDGINVSLPNRT